MGLTRDVSYKLKIKADAYLPDITEDRGRQQTVIIALATTQPVPIAIEGHTGDESDDASGLCSDGPLKLRKGHEQSCGFGDVVGATHFKVMRPRIKTEVEMGVVCYTWQNAACRSCEKKLRCRHLIGQGGVKQNGVSSGGRNKRMCLRCEGVCCGLQDRRGKLFFGLADRGAQLLFVHCKGRLGLRL